MIDDRPAVIVSREDITAGLLGSGHYSIDGYSPRSVLGGEMPDSDRPKRDSTSFETTAPGGGVR